MLRLLYLSAVLLIVAENYRDGKRSWISYDTDHAGDEMSVTPSKLGDEKLNLAVVLNKFLFTATTN